MLVEIDEQPRTAINYLESSTNQSANKTLNLGNLRVPKREILQSSNIRMKKKNCEKILSEKEPQIRMLQFSNKLQHKEPKIWNEEHIDLNPLRSNSLT